MLRKTLTVVNNRNELPVETITLGTLEKQQVYAGEVCLSCNLHGPQPIDRQMFSVLITVVKHRSSV